MTLLWFLAEGLFYGVCGFVGHIFMKVLTRGKVELDYGETSEGIVAEMVGVVVLLGLAIGVSQAIP